MGKIALTGQKTNEQMFKQPTFYFTQPKSKSHLNMKRLSD
jgi:hypothetical protein